MAVNRLGQQDIVSDAKAIFSLLSQDLRANTGAGSQHEPVTLSASVSNLFDITTGQELQTDASLARGDLFTVNASTEMDRLAHPGGAGWALTTDSDDVLWDQTPLWSGLAGFGAGLTILDDQPLNIGTDLDTIIVYDEAGDDRTEVTGADWLFDSLIVNIGTAAGGGGEKLAVREDQDAVTAGEIVNANGGTAAAAFMRMKNTAGASGAAGAHELGVGVLGTGFTTSGIAYQDSAMIQAGGSLSGGLTIRTLGATPIVCGVNAGTEVWRADANGLTVPDDVYFNLGTGLDTRMRYDEAGDDRTEISGADWLFDTLDIAMSSAVSLKPTLTMENTNADGQALSVEFYKNSVSPADDDNIAEIIWFANDSAGDKQEMAAILGEELDRSDAVDAGGLRFSVTMNHVSRQMLMMSGYNGTPDEGEFIVNEEGQDVDVRFEADGVPNALQIQGSDGEITLGALATGLVKATAGVLSIAIATDLPAHAVEHEVGGGDLVNHDSLTGFIADEHVAHSGVTLTAGAGLTGGGTIAANRTFAVGAGNGLTVNANDVALTIPGTLTVATGNSAAGNHTHAVTSSANPGVAASLLASDANGRLELEGLGVNVAASAAVLINASLPGGGFAIKGESVTGTGVFGGSTSGNGMAAASLSGTGLIVDLAGAGLAIANFKDNGTPVLTVQDGGQADFAEYIRHLGDTNTYLRFNTDEITLRAGGIDAINIIEGANDYVNLLVDTQVGAAGVPPGTLTVSGELRIIGSDAFAADTAQLYLSASSGLVITGKAGSTFDFAILESAGQVMVANPQGTNNVTLCQNAGNVGIGTATPGQIFDVNSGSGNMIADGYDTHSLEVYKENIEIAQGGFIDKIKAFNLHRWNRRPFVSTQELVALAVIEFDITEPIENPRAFYRDLLEDDPIRIWIDAKRIELRQERRALARYQRRHIGLVADDPATVAAMPNLASRNDDGEIVGYSMTNHVGFLHGVIRELVNRVELLEAR